MGEVYEVEDAVNQRQSHGKEGVDATSKNAVQDGLK